MKKYDVFEFLSQRKDGEMPKENEFMVSFLNILRRTTADSSTDEKKSGESSDDVIKVNEGEKRFSEKWAKQNNCWIPFSDIFSLGVPGPSGSESDTYVAKDSYIYKTNNLMHCRDSIVLAIEKFLLYNVIFPDSAYELRGFTGFDGRSVYPITRQRYIKGGIPVTQNEIDCYMSAIGMEKISLGRYENKDVVVWDVLPKNVLKDDSGDIFVIDVEIMLK